MNKQAWFKLGRWGMLVNTVAVVYGGLMVVNIGVWQDKGLFGEFAGSGRALTNPNIDAFIAPFGNPIAGLPAWPVCEVLVGALILTGAIYYALQVRGRAHDVEADTITGEAEIA